MTTDLVREACLIDGDWVTGDGWTEVDDPATGDVIGRVPTLGADHAERAVAAAQAAMPAWAARTAQDRGLILKRFAALMIERQDALAALLTREQGKPLAEARGEIAYAASYLEWFAEEGKRAYGEIIPTHAADKRLFVLKQPVGVVGAITPWNFPAAMVTRKIAPALAAGCAVVLKPSEKTPFSALALGVLAQQAGVPDGVLNIVTGDSIAIGRVLTDSAIVRKISFTGSTGVGAKLMEQSARTIKKLSLELGGNAPFIVFDDADVDAAVAGCIASKFRNAGQTCVSVNRIYVQAPVHDAFVAKLAEAVAALRVGNGFDQASEVGPLIDARAVAKVEAHIADAVAQGATIVAGGKRLSATFFEPTVLSGVTAEMAVTREETFGPLAAVVRFDSDAEAVEQANASPYGLAAYVYARDIGRVWKIAEAIESGMIGINTGLLSTEVAPFGGVKASGLGREGSRHGLEDYLETKYLCVAL